MHDTTLTHTENTEAVRLDSITPPSLERYMGVLNRCFTDDKFDPETLSVEERRNLTSVLGVFAKIYDKLGSGVNNEDLDDLIRPSDKDSDRFVIFPIIHKDIWDYYKKAEACFWTANEVKLAQDIKDWEEKMTEDERFYIKQILAFFASADGIVNENLLTRFATECQWPEIRAFYTMQAQIETVHCVAPETMILTDRGYFEIAKLVNKTVNVFNGQESSSVVIKRTSDKTDLISVGVSNGMQLRCTPDHKFYLFDRDEPVLARDLKISDQLRPWTYPIVQDHEGVSSMTSPYTFGYVFGQRHHLEKNSKRTLIVERYHIAQLEFVECKRRRDDRIECVVEPRYYGSMQFVPFNLSLSTRIEWLTGLWNSCGRFEDNDKRYHLGIRSSKGASDLQLLLSTLGVFSVNHGRHVSFSECGARALFKLGVTSVPVDDQVGGDENPDAVITISSLAADGAAETYCFSEPKRHMGIFGGICTGQSETYSLFIDTLVKNKEERKFLFESLENVPAIRKKADWALKWISSREASFGERLLAFACVEGIFFSGSFAAIFWLKSRSLMNGLAWANDKILSDEGLHTEFACHLYQHHLNKSKPSTERAYQIVREAVDIEIEFQTESIPCPFPELNADRMRTYIQFVGDYTLQLCGLDKIYNVRNPFTFMETIAFRTMSNQFERDNPSYQILQGEKTFDITNDF